jgi:uncharacterized membrane protein YedE/YeeE
VTDLSTALPRPTTAGATPALGIDVRVVSIALVAFVTLSIYLRQVVHWRQATLFLVGGVLGLVLYHAAFGFTSSWRVLISDRRGAGVRGQMLMLAVACILFFPVLNSGTPLFTDAVRGNVNPLGISVVVGAFLFGLGMQLGGGCASGTLFTVGGGNARMVVTLGGFIAGSAIGAAHAPWWQSLPELEAVSLVDSFGPWTALIISLTSFGAIAAGTVIVERRRHGRRLPGPTPVRHGLARVLSGPWPLVAGAIGLALANFATLALAGRPWGITSGFALWGSKTAALIGFDPVSWTYWSSPARHASLVGSVFEHTTSVMNVGIVLGALMASGLAGRFNPAWSASRRSLAAAIGGGLLLGYGARLAYGCNIGAYFSGVASGSLHGWLWLVAAFAGSVVGTRLRPACDMIVERTETRSP